MMTQPTITFLGVRRTVRRLLPCLLTGLLAGCGGSDAPETAPVTGTVMYKGGPLAGAQVTFVPDTGPVSMGMTDLEGKFSLRTGALKGAVVGPAKASVTIGSGEGTGELAEPMTPEQMMEMQMAGKLEPAMKKQNKSMIPEKYTRADTSGLNYEVKSGEDNDFLIELN